MLRKNPEGYLYGGAKNVAIDKENANKQRLLMVARVARASMWHSLEF